MEVLISIGEFARMTCLSVKILRHYHEIGLLVPASVDPETGYRRYGTDQVTAAQIIRRFRDLRMPLDDLVRVVHAPDVATRNRVISAHLRRMETDLEQTRSTVGSLRQLLAGPPTPAPVTVDSAPAMSALAQRTHLAEGDGSDWLRAAHTELRAALVSSGLARAGADGALFASELFDSGEGEVVAFLPIHEPPPGMELLLPAGVEWFEVPAAELAVVEHLGGFEDVDQAYATLGWFITEHAVWLDGPMREHYLVGALDTDDEHDYRTQVGWPIFRTTDDKLPTVTKNAPVTRHPVPGTDQVRHENYKEAAAMSVTPQGITFETTRPEQLAKFWAQFLGHEIDPVYYPGFITIGTESGCYYYVFQKADAVATGRNRVQVGFSTPDLHAESERLLGLGATIIEEVEQDGIRYTIFADPEGNRFDLTSE